MNIVKLQNELKNVPDQALIGYVQNPTGQVPSYLALSELQRRKEMREKYQQAQPSKTTVAEDLEQAATPQPSGLAMLAKNPTPQGAPIEQGVAGLPTGDMYQEQNFATGGIVAFDDGGDVKGYAGPDGSYVYSTDYDPVEQYRRARQLGIENVIARNYNMPTTSATKAGIKTPYDDALNYYEGLRQQAAVSGKGLSELKRTTDALQSRREAWLSGSIDPFSRTNPVGSKPNIMGNQEPIAEKTKPSGQPDVTLGADEIKKQPATAGVGFDGSFYDKMLTKEAPLKDIMKEYTEALGTDPTLAARQKRLEKMDERAAKMEERAPWMALMEAGLGMAAGTSPFALKNISEGALLGVKSYAAAQDKLADLEEKRFTLDNELAKQQRAENVAAVTYGVNSRQHKEEMNKTIMLAKAKDKLTRDVANLEANVNLTTKAAANAPKIDKIAEARASYPSTQHYKDTVAKLQKKYGDNAIKDSSPRHPEFQRDLETIRELYLAELYSPIGSTIPRTSTQGFEITNPKK